MSAVREGEKKGSPSRRDIWRFAMRDADVSEMTVSGDSPSSESFSQDYSHMSCSVTRNEIAEKLCKLKIDHNSNGKSDSARGMHDPILGNEEDSIVVRNTPSDSIFHRSVHSLVDSRHSVILAGRLNSLEDVYTTDEDQSLLNTAINESGKVNGNDTAIYLSMIQEDGEVRYMDSLEVPREGRPQGSENERDSLETEAWYTRDVSQTENAFNNNPNVESQNPSISGNITERRSHGIPKILSIVPAFIPKQSLENVLPKQASQAIREEEYVSRDKNDNIQQNFNSSQSAMAYNFHSIFTESERLITADTKTPNSRAVRGIHDYHDSSPLIGCSADIFRNEFIADVSNFSMVYDANTKGDAANQETNCRNKIFRRLSQRFAESPVGFTENLLTLFEESTVNPSRSENLNSSDVSLSRLTEEFKKFCKEYGKRIEDETMPDFGVTICQHTTSALEASQQVEVEQMQIGSDCRTVILDESSVQNFSRLGGGKKSYRKTPRRVANKSYKSPNRAVSLHGPQYNNSPDWRIKGNYDDTATFEFWERLCYEMSPTKQGRTISPHKKYSNISTCEDFMRKAVCQMASIDESIGVNAATGNTIESPSAGKNVSTTMEDCQDGFVSTRQKHIEHLLASVQAGNNKCDKNLGTLNNRQCTRSDADELEVLLTAQLVEKRRQCFEKAGKILNTKESPVAIKDVRSAVDVSESVNKTESAAELEHDPRFLSTLSACIDYYDHVQTLHNYRNSLHCIPECTEDLESITEKSIDSQPPQFVEAIILPVQNHAKHKTKCPEIEKAASSQTSKLIATTSLYLHGSPECCTPKSTVNGVIRKSSVSPSRVHSRGAQLTSVLAKKIKSPVSPIRRKKLKAVKPASHTCVPRSPTRTPRLHVRKDNQNFACESRTKCDPSIPGKVNVAANSPGLMNVTNINQHFEIPKVIVTNTSPCTPRDSAKKKQSSHVLRQLQFTHSETPKCSKQKKPKYFFTPEKSPTYGKVRPKKKYFETPKNKQFQKELSGTTPSSPGSHRVNYNTVLSPVAMYIRGTDPNLIKNVVGKTNEYMLTPRVKTPNSKSTAMSPILARSPQLKFKVTPVRKQKVQQEIDIFNTALCESNTSSYSPLPSVFYQPAMNVKMVKDSSPQKLRSKALAEGIENRIIYQHKGRLKTAASKRCHIEPSDCSSAKDTMSSDMADISVLHERPPLKSNYLLKK